MSSNEPTVIISGSSTTNDSAWPTWATWIEKSYQPKNLRNLSIKGLGNEAIIVKAVQAANQETNPFIIVQLTSVDKWDWYVQNPTLVQQMNNEKHNVTLLAPDDSAGYWSTGSHFPKWKEHYAENYFSIDHAMFHTLTLIQWFQLLCEKQSWPYIILFDSPIFSVAEQQLNTGRLTLSECHATTLVENTLCRVVFDQLDLGHIYTPGLIGYACMYNQPWYSTKFKGHPGSLVHYHFAQDIVSPAVSQILTPKCNLSDFLNDATKFQKLFHI